MLFCIAVVTIFVVFISVNERSYRLGQHVNHVTLPDIIHNNVIPIYAYKALADGISAIIVTICTLYILYKRHYDVVVFFVVSCVILQATYLLVVTSTTLPDCSKNCVYSSTFFHTLRNMGTCNNLGISGHLCYVGLSLFTASLLQGHSYWPAYVALYACAFFFIAASRNHYTLDCIVSTLVVALIASNSDKILQFSKMLMT